MRARRMVQPGQRVAQRPERRGAASRERGPSRPGRPAFFGQEQGRPSACADNQWKRQFPPQRRGAAVVPGLAGGGAKLASRAGRIVAMMTLRHSRDANAKSEGEMAESKVTIERKPNDKWACFLHLPEAAEGLDLGKEFKTEERAEAWLDTSEAVTAIDVMTRKHKK